ncbi:U-box domain-containing protein kinase family protein [Trifolium repens]|nr:U-box domain-containing protein kinase family protein [Trifolium repens]
MQIDESITDDTSEISFSSSSSSNYTSTTQADSGSVASYAALHSSSLATQRFQALSSMNQNHLNTTSGVNETNHSRGQSIDLGQVNVATNTDTWVYDQNSLKDAPLASKLASPNIQENFNLELEKLRIELRHVQGMHAVAQNENIDASRKLSELSKRRSGESMKMKEIIAKEEVAQELARQAIKKYEAAAREAAYLKESSEREASERKETELKAIRAAKEKEKLEDAVSGSTPQYRNFLWDEIVSATSSFSEDQKIGMGAYGMVYKCTLHHTTVAVKVLHSPGISQNKQFQQEDVLDDPCVAADGYTYDRKAIEKWLEENDKSPMTNMALHHKFLIPNYTLLSAILEWKSKEI